MRNGISIAIDGPIAAGKGTVALALADKLDGFFMNTGAMYRSLALICIEKGIDMSDERAVEKVLPQLNIEFKNKRIFLNNVDVTERIKEPDVANASSVVAVYGKVREYLVNMQQKIAEHITNQGQIVIADGRDTVTKVLPKADLKIFLTASLKVRAQRSLERYREKGINKNIEEVIAETKERDGRDINRDIDPLASNPSELGYWILDNSNQTENQTINIIMEELKKKGLIYDKD